MRMERIMQKTLFATCLILLYVIPDVWSIQCYHCVQVSRPAYESTSNQTRLCSKFDYSNYYIKDCPYSTMCMKKVFEYEPMPGKKILGTKRDCAPQQNRYHVFRQGNWTPESSIEEPYQEGCQSDPFTKGTVRCYCRGYLCNGARKTKGAPPSLDLAGYHTDAMAVMFVFNAMKYLRSER